MSDSIQPVDVFQSNGTCYFNVHSLAGSTFIACGNAALPQLHWPCCSLGDNCLSSGACYNARWGTTYLAGCTDPEFSASACTGKGIYHDQQFVGLVRCMKSNDYSRQEEEWAGCAEPVVDHLVQPEKCACDSTKTALFKDGPRLTNIAALPTSPGGSISFFSDMTPTALTLGPTRSLALTTTTTQTSDPNLSTTQRVSSTTQAIPMESSSPESGLSTSAKVGLGAGIAVGALLIGIIVVLALLLRKRKKKHEEHEAKPFTQTDSSATPGSTNINTPMSTGFSGYKAELAAEDPPPSSTLVSPLSPLSPAQSQFSGQRHYEAYNPDRHGDYARYSNMSELYDAHRGPSPASLVSPQNTGASLDRPNGGNGGNAGSTQRPMAPISELQG
ncbi:hypothetical protein BJ170DRAFT_611683 [Xylariales sp. AK1849]|nr:hypothetical protein BJ170DRAFT_611683 [Xylariales sp. AK1849]